MSLENSSSELTKQRQQLRDEAANELGFPRMKLLAEAAGINEGDLSRFANAKRKPSPRAADKLFQAIYEKNNNKGWTYQFSALQFQAYFNHLRNHIAYSRGERSVDVPQIEDEDIRYWCIPHFERLAAAESDFDNPVSILVSKSSPDEALEELVAFSKQWEFRHNFGLLGPVKRRFEVNALVAIRSAVRRATDEGVCYEHVGNLYLEIRNFALLCRSFPLISKMATWLRYEAIERSDIFTEAHAILGLTWVLTSEDTQESLIEAQSLVRELDVLFRTGRLLDTIQPENMDIVANYAEIRLRLTNRLLRKKLCVLSRQDFTQLIAHSKRLITQAKAYGAVPSRLKDRYTIPLDYQEGVFLYLIGDYEHALMKFEKVLARASYVGWFRIEQAAYSWRATLFYRTGDIDACVSSLDRITALCLLKRQQLRQQLFEKLAGDSTSS